MKQRSQLSHVFFYNFWNILLRSNLLYKSWVGQKFKQKNSHEKYTSYYNNEVSFTFLTSLITQKINFKSDHFLIGQKLKRLELYHFDHLIFLTYKLSCKAFFWKESLKEKRRQFLTTLLEVHQVEYATY